MSQYKLIEGQCGTCKNATSFDYATSPSEPEDGVHCTSLEQAKMLDDQCNPEDPADPCYNQYQNELQEYGSMDLWRLEALAEESFRCENWEPNEAWLAKKTPPQLAGH